MLKILLDVKDVIPKLVIIIVLINVDIFGLK